MGFADFSTWVFSALRVIGSTVVGEHSAVLVGGAGAVGSLDDRDGDNDGEQMTDAEAFGAPGIVFRPRPPEAFDGKELSAEAIAARTPGGMLPLAWRDLRLNRVYPAPKPGTVALVGYGGGFLAFDDTDAKESLATWYVPYAFVDGVPTKAHVIALDPSGEAIQVIHGEGLAFILDKDNGITTRADAQTWSNMKPGKFTVVASSIVLQGNVALGGNPLAAVPLLPGVASPPSLSVFVSP